MLAYLLIFAGVLARLVPHPPNFSPLLAIALFGGVTLSKRTALIVPLAVIMTTDLILGIYPSMAATWASFALIVMMGIWLRRHAHLTAYGGVGLGASLLFFGITNLAYWYVRYPHTIDGLTACFVAAIPFFQNTVLSTFFYGAILFGTYEICARRIRGTRWERTLLVE